MTLSITRVQANTIPLHGDARATIEAMLPYLAEAGAGERSSPARGYVVAARRLIAYYDIQRHEPQYRDSAGNSSAASRRKPITVWDITQLGFYARTHWRVNHPKVYVDSGYSFNLGYSFDYGAAA